MWHLRRIKQSCRKGKGERFAPSSARKLSIAPFWWKRRGIGGVWLDIEERNNNSFGNLTSTKNSSKKFQTNGRHTFWFISCSKKGKWKTISHSGYWDFAGLFLILKVGCLTTKSISTTHYIDLRISVLREIKIISQNI